ncbi:MAG: peptidylprolyl isomerase [Thermoanaerobaculia bacterium]
MCRRDLLGRFVVGVVLAGLAALAATAGAATVPSSSQDARLQAALLAEARARGLAAKPGIASRIEAGLRLERRRLFEERCGRDLPAPGPQEVAGFLAANAQKLVGGEQLHLRNIFLRVAREASPAEREPVRRELESLRQAIVDGADFAALARERSNSETAKFGGALKPFRRGELPPQVEAVVWKLAPGEVSGVLETPVGFHLFRLDSRDTSPGLSEAEAADWAKLRLTSAARTAAREREWNRLLAAAQAHFDLTPLAVKPLDATATVFDLGKDPLTVADVLSLRSRASFAESHNADIENLARDEALDRLLRWAAEHESAARSPEFKRRLAAVRDEVLVAAAAESRVAAWAGRVPEVDLHRFFDADPSRFFQPEQFRLSVIAVRFPESEGARAAAEAFDRLDSVARKLRSGSPEFADAAREISDDPSASSGGDLGWVEARDLALWAGSTTLERIGALVPGEISSPLLLEVYREEILGFELQGYLLVRVDAHRPVVARTFTEALPDVAGKYAVEHAGEAQAAIARELVGTTDPASPKRAP